VAIGNKILFFCFFLTVFFLTRQVPFSGFSLIMNLSMISFIIVYVFINKGQFKRINDFNFPVIISVVIFTFAFIYSVFFTNALIGNSLRFYLIILSLILAYNIVNLPFSIVKIFIRLMLLQSIFIILLEVFYLTLSEESTQLILRDFIRIKEWGDIYSNGYFFHIQLKGNALIPFGYMLTYLNLPFKSKLVTRIIFLTGLIFAGNFAFIISALFFHIVYFVREIYTLGTLIRKVSIGLLVILVTSIPLITFVDNKLESKRDDSIFERVQQFELLFNGLTQNFYVLFLGNGLGNTLNVKTATRDYSKSIYFEVQPIYFVFQLGILMSFYFVFINLYLVERNYKNYLVKLIYVCYLIYSITNPYILDTNHFIVIIVLNAAQYKLNEYRSELKCISQV
jgi:hypothetical protein